jgi:hypothetical protein
LGNNRIQSAGALSAAAAAVLFAVAGPAAAASGPASTTVLSLTGFTSIVADSVHQQVFVSGAGSDPVEVTDFTGKPLSTLASVDLFTPGDSTPTATYQLGGFGVYGLAWNQAGSELFAVSTASTPSSSTPTLNVIDLS